MNCRVIAFAFFIFCSFLSHAQDSLVTIHGFVIIGNKKTKPRIIYREILFAQGDSLSPASLRAKIKQSEKNLINTRLFNFATIKAVPIDENRVAIQIKLEERWYVWPSPIFELAETNFNTWWLTKDFSRTNYGGFVRWKNFRGLNDELYVKLRFGYNEEFRISYRFPYFNKKQSIGLGISFDYFQQKEITTGTLDHKREFIRVGDLNMRQEYQYKLQGFYRKNIFTEHLAELRLSEAVINDTVVTINPDYLLQNQTNVSFLTFIYRVKIDKRDVRAYPLQGSLSEVLIQKNGFGLLNKEFKQLSYALISFKKYITHKNGWFSGISLKQKIAWYQNEPYYTQKGLGYSDFVRGYEYYVIDAQQYSLIKTNLKYQILKPKVRTFNFIKIDQFKKIPLAAYLNAFLDAGYANDKIHFASNTTLSNKWLIGYGIGLDLVSYYDKVFRLECSRNSLNEMGIFLHFKQPL